MQVFIPRMGAGGNGGSHTSSSEDDLKSQPERQAMMLPGVPMSLTTISGGWGITLNTSASISAAMDEALARLGALAVDALPYAGRLAGMVVGMLIPSSHYCSHHKKTALRRFFVSHLFRYQCGFSSASAWLTMFSTVKPNSGNSLSAGADSPNPVMPTMAPLRPTYLYQ